MLMLLTMMMMMMTMLPGDHELNEPVVVLLHGVGLLRLFGIMWYRIGVRSSCALRCLLAPPACTGKLPEVLILQVVPFGNGRLFVVSVFEPTGLSFPWAER